MFVALDYTIIGERLRTARLNQKLTQEKLAEKIEVSVRYISDIEQNRAKPSYEVLIKICNLFNIGINQIFSEYLKIQENKTLKYSLAGFEKLNKKDKETIENLIMYFNKN